MEDILKKQRAEDDDKSLMNKIHTGVTACLRMAGVAAPLPSAASGSGHQQPQQQGQAPPGKQQGVPPPRCARPAEFGRLGLHEPFQRVRWTSGWSGTSTFKPGCCGVWHTPSSS